MKKDHHLDVCRLNRMDFTAFIVACDGVYGREADRFIRRLAELINKRAGWDKYGNQAGGAIEHCKLDVPPLTNTTGAAVAISATAAPLALQQSGGPLAAQEARHLSQGPLSETGGGLGVRSSSSSRPSLTELLQELFSSFLSGLFAVGVPLYVFWLLVWTV
ncbi:unnamed protein product [Vitrella brassicaformis CCMP3155]|uniref:Uncharacterized protein n=1 Tax=Vitrella brassicaformis (strain CCMP3155) TaxID=1169540 RepID=A0A0G4FUZ5_VITBC|nr:unnamed protein product [Vitrella brassicaformis CCMP3155]|eukprot:CEM18778.1 unnamed protein product [Vitrella brassicaformis CCMP3155]